MKCLECDLWQPGEPRGAGCRFCEGDLPKEQDGLQVPGEEALDLQACSWTQAVQWHEEEVRSHWQLKRMWLDQLNQVAGQRTWRMASSPGRTADGPGGMPTMPAWSPGELEDGGTAGGGGFKRN